MHGHSPNRRDLEHALEQRARTRALNRKLEQLGIEPLELVPPPTARQHTGPRVIRRGGGHIIGVR